MYGSDSAKGIPDLQIRFVIDGGREKKDDAVGDDGNDIDVRTQGADHGIAVQFFCQDEAQAEKTGGAKDHSAGKRDQRLVTYSAMIIKDNVAERIPRTLNIR